MLDPYLRAALQKGVPPLFTDILSLYDDPERIKIIENLMYGYLKNLKETGHLCETGKSLFRKVKKKLQNVTTGVILRN